MAVDVYTLLSLPKSAAFSKFRDADLGRTALKAPIRSDSPPRKTPRLAADSDSASASRSRAAANDRAGEKKGPVIITLHGPPVKPPANSIYDAEVRLTRRAITLLLTKAPPGSPPEAMPGTYEQIYNACRSVVCGAHKGEGLYDHYKQEVERCVSGLTSALAFHSAGGVEWLGVFNAVCQWFESQVGLLQSLFAYLDRVYVVEHKDLQPIRAVAYTRFQSQVFGDSAIVSKLQEGIQAWITWERENMVPHEQRDLIPELIRHLEHHGVYFDLFAHFFLEITRVFYQNESNRLHGEYSAKAFLEHCEKRYMEERKRATELFPRTTTSALLDVVDNALLCERLQWISEGELPRQMDEEQDQSLASMYRLFARVDGQKVLQASFKIYVQKRVASIVSDTAHEDKMVDTLLAFKAFCDKLVSSVFLDEVSSPLPTPSPTTASTSALPEPQTPTLIPNQEFSYALIDAFQQGFRARRNKPAEMIAKYIDKAMRKGQKGKEDAAFMGELDRVLVLYRFTDDKDVFRTFYHRALAKRLLLEKSASDDFEKATLKKLKEEYDPDFGMGDHMFKDLDLSRGLMQEYIEKKCDGVSQRLSVMVLQRSVWPFTARKTDAKLPEWMQKEVAAYAAFYIKEKHTGHKLDWDHALGTATLRARFKAGEKELSVSLYQAIILLQFNDADEVSYERIKLATQMDDADLRRTLQSLACGKKRVLRKVPAGKDVNDGDVFHFNADFTDAAFRVHINSIQVKETPEESRRTQSFIEADRRYALDAAIVRIMKSRKELHYEGLKTATIEAVKKHFLPDVASIKQRIDGLVEQEYLRRKEGDMNVLVYLA